jgi:hypothetical protein
MAVSRWPQASRCRSVARRTFKRPTALSGRCAVSQGAGAPSPRVSAPGSSGRGRPYSLDGNCAASCDSRAFLSRNFTYELDSTAPRRELPRCIPARRCRPGSTPPLHATINPLLRGLVVSDGPVIVVDPKLKTAARTYFKRRSARRTTRRLVQFRPTADRAVMLHRLVRRSTFVPGWRSK